MKIIVPDYYKNFRCIAGACSHSCCEGWEIDIDSSSLERYKACPDILPYIDFDGTPHFRLNGERCPFLREDKLCSMIIGRGEDFLCQICRDHPRFRNFWTGRTEIGLGMACEEAARIILSREEPMELTVFEDDGINEALPEDEQWLMDVRSEMLSAVRGNGPDARLLEYLIFRHIADALYDDRLQERAAFIQKSYDMLLDAWDKTDGNINALAECARAFSVKYEYAAGDPISKLLSE